MIVPPALRPGARLRLVAPSSPFDRTLVFRGLSFLKSRYRVEHDHSAFSRHGFLAGDDTLRLGELQRALDDPGLAGIVAARGGYGLTRIAHRLDLSALRRHPKWIVGFSDLTALHVEAARVGVASMHAHNVAGLGRGDAHARADWIDALERPEALRSHCLDIWKRGQATGPLFGGNLTLLFTCAAAGRLRPPDGAVWFIEDVTETSYRIDRMLSALLATGAFDRAAGIVIGDFTACSPGIYSVPTLDVLRDRLCELGIPVYAGLRAGHGRFNTPLCLGTRARLKAGTLSIGEA